MRGLTRIALVPAVLLALATAACLDSGAPYERTLDPSDQSALSDSLHQDSTVTDSTYVPPDTTVGDSTYVPPDTTVSDSTWVPPDTTVSDSTYVPPDTTVGDSTYVPPDTTVSDSTYVPPDTTVSDSTYIPPDTTGGDSTAALALLTLLTPDPGAVIPQNDSTLGCPEHPHRGYGLQIHFSWDPPDSTSGVAFYHLFAKKDSVQYPILDGYVTGTEYLDTRCNTFVIDRNLDGWYWHVVAHDSGGTAVAASETRWFSFAPCRLANGQPCTAPAEPAPSGAEGADRSPTGMVMPPGR